VEILNRKLTVVASRYAKSQLEYERYAVLAVSSLYGIDILADNVAACQARLLEVFNAQYSRLFKNLDTDQCRNAVRYILSRNILHGDALTLKTVGNDEVAVQAIVFSEWSAVNGSMLKRRDFVYAHLVEQSSHREMPLFSDLDEEAYIPEPVKDYPLIHFLEVGDAG
jgi:Mn-containing catalase